MKNAKRLTALLLSVGILAAGMSGCGGSTDPDASASTSPDASASPTVAAEAHTAPDFAEDTLILTIAGKPVYWPEFKYWLNYSLQYSGASQAGAVDWDAEYSDGLTLREYILQDAVKAVALYRVIDKTAEEMGLEISEADNANIDSIIQSNRSYFETDEEYDNYLAENYLSNDLMEYLLRASCNYYNIFVRMFGENGEQVSDADALAYGADNGFYRAKHILLAAKDADGNEYSEDEMQQKFETLQGLLEQLRSSSEPTVLFDELMSEYSEDPGLATYPEGYQFTAGTMDSDFQAALEKLDDYGISDVVKIRDGYTIIMRLPLDPDGVALADGYGYTLRYNTANHEYETLANTWVEEAEIVYSEDYARVDPSDWF